MTTPLFLLRCVQIGLSIRDLDLLTIGMVNDMYAESGNDDCKYARLASQEDFDSFWFPLSHHTSHHKKTIHLTGWLLYKVNAIIVTDGGDILATYKEIQEYVKGKYGFQPKTCWIAHMKEVCGLPVKVAPNRYSLDKREKPCPTEKQDAIRDAFRHFEML